MRGQHFAERYFFPSRVSAGCAGTLASSRISALLSVELAGLDPRYRLLRSSSKPSLWWWWLLLEIPAYLLFGSCTMTALRLQCHEAGYFIPRLAWLRIGRSEIV